MSTSSKTTRLDLRITKRQKEHFEHVIVIGGFRSLTDFVVSAATEKADAILEKHNHWLVSENDRRVFFEALLNPPEPTKKLKAALKKHRDFKRKK